MKAGYKRVDPQLRTLEEGNARLEKIIADQALELEFKTELFKKAMPIISRQRSDKVSPH